MQTDRTGDMAGKRIVMSKLDEIIKGLDDEALDELQKYVSYLKVRQTLSPQNDEISAGSDADEKKEGIK